MNYYYLTSLKIFCKYYQKYALIWFVTRLFPYIVIVHRSLYKRNQKSNMKIQFLVAFNIFKVRTWTNIFGVTQDEKNNSKSDDQFFSASLKSFSTGQKSRMKTSDFRPTLKAHEMAQCHQKSQCFRNYKISPFILYLSSISNCGSKRLKNLQERNV